MKRQSYEHCANRYYIAYGSNLNTKQMDKRCPDLVFVGTTKIDGFRLAFRKNMYGNKRATIEKDERYYVPVVVYKISESDENELDENERANVGNYVKKNIKVTLQIDNEIKDIKGLIYILPKNSQFMDSNADFEEYLGKIKVGYKEFGFDESILDDAVNYRGESIMPHKNTKRKKVSEKELINLDSILFKCRDILRKARNSGSFFEKRDMMLTLVFLRFIGEKYEDGVVHLKQKLISEGLDPNDEKIIKAFFDDATFADGTYNLPPESRWSVIINTPAPSLNVVLDTALHSIASNSKQLKGCFVEGTFTTRNLAPNDIKQLVDEVNKISHKAFGEEKDLIGHVYEYFLKEFAVNATKEEGEFYTPHDVVQLIATLIEPFDGTLYDPCCGSGGMFIQSSDLVKAKSGDISRINVYGQEKDAATYRLAKMNLALRGISHNLGGENDSTFSHDLHKGLYFNYIMANPPFNLKGWYENKLENDPRWADYSTPPDSNANYAWILHMLYHLKPLDGVAGFLLANGALGDTDTVEIREKLIKNDKIEAIIILPRELFITTDISVTLWILNQNKKGGVYHNRKLRNREHEILFVDLRTWTENPVKDQNKKKVQLVTEQIERAANIYHTWQCEGTDGSKYEIPELYRSVNIQEIEQNSWSLVPSKYIEFIDHDLEIDFPKEMKRIQKEMSDLIVQEKESQKMLEEAFKGIGYEI